VISLFEGEKALLFWAGLIILSLASVVLFSVIWSYRSYASSYISFGVFFLNNLPLVVGAIVFILIGLYMMKSGVKEKDSIIQEELRTHRKGCSF
jgi:putative Mn2+ efflux pump MntP